MAQICGGDAKAWLPDQLGHRGDVAIIIDNNLVPSKLRDILNSNALLNRLLLRPVGGLLLVALQIQAHQCGLVRRQSHFTILDFC
jgi:hypothetical protein